MKLAQFQTAFVFVLHYLVLIYFNRKTSIPNKTEKTRLFDLVFYYKNGLFTIKGSICATIIKCVKTLSSTIWPGFVLALLDLVPNATLFIIQKGLPTAALATPEISTVWKAEGDSFIRL